MIAAMHDPAVTVADLTDHICQDNRAPAVRYKPPPGDGHDGASYICPAAIGGVPVYFDATHLTTTYARTLAPYLAPYLRRAVSH